MASMLDLHIEADQGKGDEEPPELFRKSEMTDITLIVEGKELHFVKFLLIEGSTVFAQMIKSSPDPSRLKLDDLAYKDLIMFLECLHPKRLLELNDRNLEPVATIARKFEYERILRICEEYIMRQFNEVRSSRDRMYPEFFFHLRVADKCGLQQAVGLSSKQAELAYFSSKGIKSSPFCFQTVKGYEDDINFSQLSLETKFRFISRRLKVAETKIPSDKPY